jgi:hypothetical protein
MRVTDQTLEIMNRIPSDGTPSENTIHDLALDLRDARARVKALEAIIRDLPCERCRSAGGVTPSETKGFPRTESAQKAVDRDLFPLTYSEPETAEVCACGHHNRYHFADGKGYIRCRANADCNCGRRVHKDAYTTETPGDVFDRYPAGTLFQKAADGRILAMTPDGKTAPVETVAKPPCKQCGKVPEPYCDLPECGYAEQKMVAEQKPCWCNAGCLLKLRGELPASRYCKQSKIRGES